MIRSFSADASYKTAFTDGSHEAFADVPVSKGGSGEGFGPHDLLEAALSTCATITVRMYAQKHGFALERVACEVRIDRSVPDTVVLVYSLTFDGPLTEEQSARLREAAERCPVSRTLSGTISVRSG